MAEVGKFRFLNELIKLVSPKYLGSSTPDVVKNKIIDLLKLWSVKFPNETKIKEAFEMLKKQGVVAVSTVWCGFRRRVDWWREICKFVLQKNNNEYENLSLLNAPQNTAVEDEEKSKKLKSLLKSNKPKDLKAANHLIKTMVKEVSVLEENDEWYRCSH